MKLLLIWLAGLSVLEVLLWTPLLWRWRRAVACLLIVTLSVVSGLLFGSRPAVWTGLVLFFSLYRLINLLRVVEGRLQPRYLYKATRRASYWLISWQLLITAVAGLQARYSIANIRWLYALAGGQLLLALLLFVSTRRHLRTTRPPAIKSSLADRDLPSLSVAIPARNETDDLEACLRSLVSSNYPKLEILVLDDCSQNKRTPGIIRDFAQSGVRFVAGNPPPKSWQAKNYAYHQLTEAANGELLLFCGVDTRFQPGSLRAMVETLLQKDKQMISWLPRNAVPAAWSLEQMFIQPARYCWELALPRRLFRRPAVLSTCWLIERRGLLAAGGFEAVMNSTAPESYIARYIARHRDGYSLLQSNETIGLVSLKTLAEQQATAVRTRYPQLHRRVELVSLFALAELACLSAPFAVLAIALVGSYWQLSLISLLSCVMLVSFYASIVRLTYRRFLLRGLWIIPFLALYDLGLLNYSMWRYEFREVIWKGRNVCVPLMQTIPNLPKLTKNH